jgi:hypothetical protein
MIYSPSPNTVTNRPLGEWSKNVVNISDNFQWSRFLWLRGENEGDGKEEIVWRFTPWFGYRLLDEANMICRWEGICAELRVRLKGG